MTASRIQHICSSALVLIIAITVTWISFDQESFYADAFLFPRLVAIFFVSLAAWNFLRAISGLAKVGEGLNSKAFMNILPGLLLALVYVFFAAKFLGFYLSSWITFLALFTLYDPAPLSSGRDWMKRLVVTTLFMVVMYCLFALLLKVQTPRGIWF